MATPEQHTHLPPPHPIPIPANVCFHDDQPPPCGVQQPEEEGNVDAANDGSLILLFSGLVPATQTRTQIENQNAFDYACHIIVEKIEEMSRAFDNVKVKYMRHASQERFAATLLEGVPEEDPVFRDIVVHFMCHAYNDGCLDMAHFVDDGGPPTEQPVEPQRVSNVLHTFVQQNPNRRLRLLSLSMCVGREIGLQVAGNMDMGDICIVGTGQNNTEIWDSGTYFLIFYNNLFSRPENPLSAFNRNLNLEISGQVQPFLVHNTGNNPADIRMAPRVKIVRKHFRVGGLWDSVHILATCTGRELKQAIREHLGAVLVAVNLDDITLTVHDGEPVADDLPVRQEVGEVVITVNAPGVTDHSTDVTYEFKGYHQAVEQFPNGANVGQLRQSIHRHIVNQPETRNYCWIPVAALQLSYAHPNHPDQIMELNNVGALVPGDFYVAHGPIILVTLMLPHGVTPYAPDPEGMDITGDMNGEGFGLAEYPSTLTVGELKKHTWMHPDLRDQMEGLNDTDLMLEYRKDGQRYRLNEIGLRLDEACPECVEQHRMIIYPTLQRYGVLLARLTGWIGDIMERASVFIWGPAPTQSLLVHIACLPDGKTLDTLESMQGVEILQYGVDSLVVGRDLSSLCWKVTISLLDEGIICNLFACLPDSPRTVLQDIKKIDGDACDLWFRGPLDGYIEHRRHADCDLLRGVIVATNDHVDISDLTDSERLLVGEKILNALVSGQPVPDVSWRDLDGSSALHWAAALDDGDVVRSVLGAGINDVNRNGSSPLHVAAMLKCERVIPELLAAGADTKLTDDRGRTPEMLCPGMFDVLGSALVKSLAHLTEGWEEMDPVNYHATSGTASVSLEHHSVAENRTCAEKVVLGAPKTDEVFRELDEVAGVMGGGASREEELQTRPTSARMVFLPGLEPPELHDGVVHMRVGQKYCFELEPPVACLAAITYSDFSAEPDIFSESQLIPGRQVTRTDVYEAVAPDGPQDTVHVYQVVFCVPGHKWSKSIVVRVIE